MEHSDRIQDLLIADLALSQGVATAEEISTALHRILDGNRDDCRSLLEVLAEISGLGAEDIAQVEESLETVLAEAGEDARQALLLRGGIDRAIHDALGEDDGSLRVFLVQQGGGPRVDLRTVSSERYREFSLIGEGGMGTVFLTLDTELSRRVAFKMIKVPRDETDSGEKTSTPLSRRPGGDTASSESFAKLSKRFLQEAWVTGALEHPGIVPVYELGQTLAGVPYYTMRFVRGARTLAEVMGAAETLEDRLDLLESFLKVCDVIRYAHASCVIHRDLKPQNIVIGEFGEVLVIDWGLAKTKDLPDLTSKQWQMRLRSYREAQDLHTVEALLGTPGYMAPEAAEGRTAEVDELSDIYSLGAILYQILTGQLPHPISRDWMEYRNRLLEASPEKAAEVNPAVPGALSEVCERALARWKEGRYSDVGELAEAIRSWQRESALEREVADLTERVEEAYAAWKSARDAERIAHLDRVNALVSRILELRPDHQRARDILRTTEESRVRAIRKLERAKLLRGVLRIAMYMAAAASLVLAGIVGFRTVPGYLDNLAAEREFEDARAATPTEAIPRLEAILREHPDAPVLPAVCNRLGDLCLELDRYHEAQVAWIRAFAEDPDGDEGVDAQLGLARFLVDQGRHLEAMHPLLRLRGRSLPRRLRAQHLLLCAEVALARGNHGQVPLFLREVDVCAPALSEEGASRRQLLQHVVRRLLPALTIPLEPTKAGRRLLFGEFRSGEGSALVLTLTWAELITARNGSIDRLRLPASYGHFAGAHVSDLDGDGVDEIILATNSQAAPSSLPGRLHILGVAGKRLQSLWEVEIPHSTYAIETGDVDGDGNKDIVLGGSYPWRGVKVLRNAGAFEYEFLDPGGMKDIASDVSGVKIADLDGDGRVEIVLATMAFKDFALMVFGLVDGMFERLANLRAGYVLCGPVADFDADGDPEILFALSSHFYRNCLKHYRHFLRQGIYLAEYDPTEGSLTPRSLVSWAQLTDRPTARPAPLSFSSRVCGVGRLGEIGPVAVVRGRSMKGLVSNGAQIQLLPLSSRDPFLLSLSSKSGFCDVRIGQLDPDEDSEIAVLSRNSLVLYGLGGTQVAREHTDWSQTERSTLTGGAVENDVARTLGAMGFPDKALQQYRLSWAKHRGDEPGRLAIAGVVSTLALLRDYDGCRHALDEYAEHYPRDRYRQRFLRARYALASWRMQEAADSFRRLTDFGHADEADHSVTIHLKERLEEWLDAPERGLPENPDWLVSGPGRCRILPEGHLEFTDETGGEIRAMLPVVWSGRSIQIRIDLKIDELGNSHGLLVGLCRRSLESRDPHGFYSRFANTSAHPSSCAILWWPDHGARLGTQILADLPQGVWLSQALTWSDKLDRVGATVRTRDSDQSVGTCAEDDVPGPWTGACDLAIGLSGEGRPARARCQVENIRFVVPEGTEFEFIAPEAGPEITYFRANAALARGDRERAGELYRIALAGGGVGEAWRDFAALTAAVIEWQATGNAVGLPALRIRIGGSDRVVEMLTGRPLLIENDELEAFLEAMK